MSDTIIAVEAVNKSFNEKKVLDDLSFTVEKGELVALLGRNGAGKTTTINLLLGLETADSGKITIFNGKPGDTAVKSKIGLTPQGTDFPEGLKVVEVLEFVGSHYHQAIEAQRAVEQFHLHDIAERLTGGLSYGQKRRVAVALAFIGQPELVFLDEPTTGLDIQSRHLLWQIVQSYIQAGGTMILTTHYLEEAERLASRVLMLDGGKICAQGSVDDITQIAGHPQVSFICDAAIDSLDHAINITKEHQKYIIETRNSDALISELVKKNIPFEKLYVHKSSLESAFVKMGNEESSK